MSIRDQIRAQEHKKGKKHYLIDTEEQVEWFLNTYVAPELSKKSYLQFKAEKEAMIEAGEIPRDINKQIEFFSLKAGLASRKLDEELKLNPKSF